MELQVSDSTQHGQLYLTIKTKGRLSAMGRRTARTLTGYENECRDFNATPRNLRADYERQLASRG